MDNQILVTDGSVIIQGLMIDNRDVTEYLSKVDEADRADVVVDAIELGIYCLQRTSTTRR